MSGENCGDTFVDFIRFSDVDWTLGFRFKVAFVVGLGGKEVGPNAWGGEVTGNPRLSLKKFFVGRKGSNLVINAVS